MKTTLDINDSLLAAAKALAAQQRTSLRRLIEDGLRSASDIPSPQLGQASARFLYSRGVAGWLQG